MQTLCHLIHQKITLGIAILIVGLVTFGASATEYAQPQFLYNYDNLDWKPKSDDLKTRIIQDCLAQHLASCSFEYNGETWVAGDSAWDKWHWIGIRSWVQGTPPQTTSGPFTGYISEICPSANEGWTLHPSSTGSYCSRDDSSDADCESCKPNTPTAAMPPSVGNPIFVSKQVKQETRVDYKNATGSLRFVRTYRSDRNRWENNYELSLVDLNAGIPSAQRPSGSCYLEREPTKFGRYCYPYMALGTTNDIMLRRGGERNKYFSSGNQYSTMADIRDRIAPIINADGTRAGWTVKNGDTQATEIYDLTGHLLSSTALNGQVTTFIYSDGTTPTSIAPTPGLLVQVTDAFGASLHFTYDTQGRLATMSDPAGGVYAYAYDANNNLTSVTYPDQKSIRYLYNEAGLATPSMTAALTGIIDENNTRYATFTYKNYYAASTEHAGGVDKYTLTLDYYSQTSVTDPLGTTRRYYFFTSLYGLKRFGGINQPAASGSGTVTSSIDYDANANVSSIIDLNGVKTTYAYDLTRNLETSRVEAAGTTAARTITTAWHPTLSLPTQRAEPKRLTTYAYDDHGNLLTLTVQASTDATGSAGLNATLTGPPRVWTFTYNQFGQMLTAKGPRTDVNDLTTYAYDDQGNLTSITNAAGHVTTLSHYDANGRVGRITDPNGLVTDLTYTPRGWLASKTVGGQNTSYTYDGVGQLTEVVLPDNSSITYTYDGAHRLTNISDSLGNSIAYTLDAIGNRTTETVSDVNGVLARKITRVYDTLNHLKTQTGGVQ